jgi:trigger factor
VKQQAEALLYSARRRMAMMGLPADVGEELWRRMGEETQARAADDVRATLLLQAVIEQEKLEVSDAELEARLAEMAESSGQDLQRVRGMYSDPEHMSALRSSMLRQKALDLLTAEADIVEGSPPSP